MQKKFFLKLYISDGLQHLEIMSDFSTIPIDFAGIETFAIGNTFRAKKIPEMQNLNFIKYIGCTIAYLANLPFCQSPSEQGRSLNEQT